MRISRLHCSRSTVQRYVAVQCGIIVCGELGVLALLRVIESFQLVRGVGRKRCNAMRCYAVDTLWLSSALVSVLALAQRTKAKMHPKQIALGPKMHPNMRHHSTLYIEHIELKSNQKQITFGAAVMGHSANAHVQRASVSDSVGTRIHLTLQPSQPLLLRRACELARWQRISAH